MRYLQTQDAAQPLTKLEGEDPAAAKAAWKAFLKVRDTIPRNSCRQQFHLAQFLESYHASDGTRFEHHGELMWEEEYYHFAKTQRPAS